MYEILETRIEQSDQTLPQKNSIPPLLHLGLSVENWYMTLYTSWPQTMRFLCILICNEDFGIGIQDLMIG